MDGVTLTTVARVTRAARFRAALRFRSGQGLSTEEAAVVGLLERRLLKTA
jgi:hypothetical protein